MNGLAEELNDNINTIWATHFADDPQPLSPRYLLPITQKSVLFVGMNPSFDEGKIRTKFREEGNLREPRDHFLWPAYWKSYNLSHELEANERVKREYRKFFELHWNIIEVLGVETWEHLDVFPIRESKQKKLMALLKSNPRLRSELLQVFRRALQGYQPKLVLVFNAAAAHIIHEEYDLGFREDLGCHEISSPEFSALVFASSMLTGQRKVDTFSKQRLIWHIKKVFNGLTANE